MNLRPPGPQPEGSERTRFDPALSGGLSCSDLVSVALNSHPRLHPAECDPAPGRVFLVGPSPWVDPVDVYGETPVESVPLFGWEDGPRSMRTDH